jgi:type IV secretory pathway VirB10-like protein
MKSATFGALIVVCVASSCLGQLYTGGARNAGGPSVKYKPIPPKPKQSTPPPQTQEPVTKSKLPPGAYVRTYSPEYMEMRRQQHAQDQEVAMLNAAARKQAQDAARQAAEQQAAERQQKLADAYAEESARAQARGEVEWEVARRRAMLEWQMQSSQPEQVILIQQPNHWPSAPGYGRDALRQGYYDRYYDSLYWGAYGGW